jgi:hypothetical protein
MGKEIEILRFLTKSCDRGLEIEVRAFSLSNRTPLLQSREETHVEFKRQGHLKVDEQSLGALD